MILDEKGDIWCLGILLYEMIHGVNPFQAENDNEIVKNILKQRKFYFKEGLDSNIIDLIKKILVTDLNKRFTFTEIFNHIWIKNLEKKLEIDIKTFKLNFKDLENEIFSNVNTNTEEFKEKIEEEAFSPTNPRLSPKKKFNDKLHKEINGTKKNKKRFWFWNFSLIIQIKIRKNKLSLLKSKDIISTEALNIQRKISNSNKVENEKDKKLEVLKINYIKLFNFFKNREDILINYSKESEIFVVVNC